MTSSRSHSRFVLRAAHLLLAASVCLGLTACTRSRAQGLRPDLAGTWDLAYEDVIEVEIMLGTESFRTRVAREGGTATLLDAGTELALQIDCSRPELVCPNEVLDTELRMSNRTGEIDEDGEVLVISLQGEGEGACRLDKASRIEARVETHGSPDARRWQAVALSGGEAVSVVSADCLLNGADSKVMRGAKVRLSAGFSAVRR